MKHLLNIDRLGSPDAVVNIVAEALAMVPHFVRRQLPEPIQSVSSTWPPKLVAIFGENSTRTRNSTEEAARAIGMAVGHPIGSGSSLDKGESWTNTARMATQQGATAIVIRSQVEGLGLHLAQSQEATANDDSWVRRDVSIIVGGAGTRDHPSQVLLDLVTIVLCRLGVRSMSQIDILERRLADPANLKTAIINAINGLTMAFVGDLLHSRVVHDWLQLSQWFKIRFILVAPPVFQVEPWCLTGLDYHQTERRGDATGADFVYTIRTQKERLGNMPLHEAEAVVRSLQITPDFLARCRGLVMDAQPIDEKSPTIPVELRQHPKVIIDMQSAMGIPTRMAILRLCHQGRAETFEGLYAPPYRFGRRDILRVSTLADQALRLRNKFVGIEVFANPVQDGAVIDRIMAGEGSTIHLINKRYGLYRSSGGAILRGERFNSSTMGTKDVIFLHHYWPPEALAAIYAIISPGVRLSYMKDGHYKRVSPSLPRAVRKLFICPNPNCVTNVEPEAETWFWVHHHGPSPEPSLDPYVNIGLQCAHCQYHFQVRSIIAELKK